MINYIINLIYIKVNGKESYENYNSAEFSLRYRLRRYEQKYGNVYMSSL